MMKTIIGLLLATIIISCAPQAPYSLPVTNNYEAKNFGTEATNIDCNYEFISTIPAAQVQDEFGYYGDNPLSSGEILGYYYDITCREVTDTTAQTIYRITFDPNNAWIKRQYCADDSCETIRLLNKDNPDYEMYLELK